MSESLGVYIPQWDAFIDGSKSSQLTFEKEYEAHGKIRHYTSEGHPFWPVGFEFDNMDTVADAKDWMLFNKQGTAQFSWEELQRQGCTPDSISDGPYEAPFLWLLEPDVSAIAGGYFVYKGNLCSPKIAPLFANDVDIFTIDGSFHERYFPDYFDLKEVREADGFTVRTFVSKFVNVEYAMPVQIIHYRGVETVQDVVNKFDLALSQTWIDNTDGIRYSNFPSLYLENMMTVSDVKSIREESETTFNRALNYLMNKGCTPDSLIINWMMKRGFSIEDIWNLLRVYDRKRTYYFNNYKVGTIVCASNMPELHEDGQITYTENFYTSY